MFYHALTGNGGTEDLEPVLLWENSSPTTAFAAQTISLDLTDYAGVIIDFFKSATENNLNTRIYVKKTDTAQFGGGFRIDSNSTIGASGRNVTINDSGVEFTDGAAGWSVTSVTTLNTDMIPYRIYGVKAYVVSPAVGDLLWHNDDPTVALGTTDVAGNYSKYSKLYIKAKLSTTIDYELEAIVEKNATYSSGVINKDSTSIAYRVIHFTDSNIFINDGNKISQATVTTDNTQAIITDIYGIE